MTVHNRPSRSADAIMRDKVAMLREAAASRQAHVASVQRRIKAIKGDPTKFDPDFPGPSARTVLATERLSAGQEFSRRSYDYAVATDRRWDLPLAARMLGRKPGPIRWHSRNGVVSRVG